MTRAICLYKRHILDMPDVRRLTNSTNDRDDVEADGLSYALVLHVVVDGHLQVLQLVEVDSLFRLSEYTASAGLHFHEHHDVPVNGDDVDVTPA